MSFTSTSSLVPVEVVDRDRDPGAAGRGDQLSGLLDGLRPVEFGAALAGGPAGGVDGGPGGAELDGDLPAGASGRPGDERDLASQRFRHATHHGRDT
jgi:hypothetical protein